MLKSCGVVGGGGGLQHFSVSPRPLGFGFGTKGFGGKGLGPGLDNIILMNLKNEHRSLQPAVHSTTVSRQTHHGS